MATLNSELFVASPTLQDYIVDKDTGAPLSSGNIYLYQDSSRTTFKNWYYQTGTPGNYSFITLSNPLTLSSVGTIQDQNGNDVIPFFYPYNENNENIVQTYFIQVYSTNSDGSIAALQFTRENFPYTPDNQENANILATLRNYIVNNRFWRNVSPGSSVNLTNETDYVLAPSQHNGFSMPNIRFKKSNNGNNDQISFTQFTSNILNNDITPQYYMRVQCLGAGTVETYKYIQIPVSLHLKTLSAIKNMSITFQAINNTADPDNTISVSLLPFTGTGTVIPSATTYQTKTIGSSWEKYTVGPITSPDASSLTIGGTGDDALYLQLGFPLNKTYDISIALPSLYLSQDIPDNDFDTYEQIDAVINTPMTGDWVATMQATYTLGWVAMNDGTIGNADSNATTRANSDTWQLFNLIYSNTTNTQCQLFSDAGVPVIRDVALTDFNNNCALSLPKQLGRVLAGANPDSLGIQKFFTASNSGGDLLLTIVSNNGDSSPFYTGCQVTFTNTGGALPTGLSAATQYYLTVINSTTFKVSTTLANALLNTPVFIAYTNAGTGTNSFTTTVTAHLLGSYVGQDTHALLIDELPAHNHPGSTVGGVNGAGTPQPFQAAIGGNTAAQGQIPGVVVAFQGGNLPHNIIQPTTYINYFIKL